MNANFRELSLMGVLTLLVPAMAQAYPGHGSGGWSAGFSHQQQP